MNFDWRVCSRARLSRDARFDGKFFIGVLTSGVYCRPICPARTAKESNVRYFPSSAAAAEAGFRPCLRCRPECSPGTPAWLGTPNTVLRALRLISENGFEDDGMEALAGKLGIGARHLRRLFLKHLGATPSAVARTRRLSFAKQLIDETNLPMSQVALAAGFGCVRRFNDSVRKTYKRTPSSIRRLVRRTLTQPENQYQFSLGFRPPYHWEGMLAFLAMRAIPGVEVVQNGAYRRSILLQDNAGYFEVSRKIGSDALAVRVQFSDPCYLYFIIERVRAMFDLSADWAEIARTLKRDAALAARLEAAPGLRVPGCWDGFELAVRAILGQQISVKGASTLAGRIVKGFGTTFAAGDQITHLFPRPEVLANADLTSAGVTSARAQTIRNLARAVVDARISFDKVVNCDEFLNDLCEIRGVGSWTAQYVAMRALGEPDAFPSGDLGLLHALALKNGRELEVRAEAWRPWRAYAAMYLWTSSGERYAAQSKHASWGKDFVTHKNSTRSRRATGCSLAAQ